METESPQHTCHRNILAEQSHGLAQFVIAVVQERDSVAAGCLAPGDAHATGAQPGGSGPTLCWKGRLRIVEPRRWGWNPNGAGSAGSCLAVSARSATSALSVSEPGAHRAHLGDASLELLGEQADDEDQDGMDQPHPALDPAYRAREPDRVAAQRIGRRAHTRSPLGMRHHRFERIEFTGQPCSQTVRQQAEGGVALGAVPASDLRPARGLARVGAVACQRTFAVRVIRAALKPCIAPRLGPNVSLAGEPRLIPKLQPAVARRGRPPARANSFSTEGVSRLRHGSCDTKR